MFYHLFLCLFSNFMFSYVFFNIVLCFLMLKKSYVIDLIWWRPPFYGFYRVRPFRDICLCKMGLPIGQKENEEKILITVLWEGFCASVVVLSSSSARCDFQQGKRSRLGKIKNKSRSGVYFCASVMQRDIKSLGTLHNSKQYFLNIKKLQTIKVKYQRC